MSDRDEIAEVLAAHHAAVGPISGMWSCPCGKKSVNGSVRDGDLTNVDERRAQYRAHLAAVLAERERRVKAEVLRDAAEWVADAVGYPVQSTYPDAPMPNALWDALVDHIHADQTGAWHGNTLDGEDVESWLADEAGRDRIEGQ